jgi:imidazolonepropionase
VTDRSPFRPVHLRHATLLTMDPARGDGPLGIVHDGTVVLEGDTLGFVGPTADAPATGDAEVVDLRGRLLVPGLVDCHTHAVWAGSRADEFRRRLAGARYEEILASGGGILSTVAATRAASDADLLLGAVGRLGRARAQGITTIEVKSGYSLDPDGEARCLRIAVEAGEQVGIDVVPTFLGAHTVPAEHRGSPEARAAYVRQIIDVQLPKVAGIARFIDAYVDPGAFTVDEAREILGAGKRAGLGVKIHAEQVAHTGITEVACALGAVSADHLERVDDAGIAAMAAAGTVAVLLPGAMLYLRDVSPPVAKLRAAGVPLAIATDLNPGSSPISDLWACATLATLTMGVTVEEAWLGVTRNAALALGLRDRGALVPGYRADLVALEAPPGEPLDPASWIQHFSAPTPFRVWRAGR